MYSIYCKEKNWYAKFLSATDLSASTWLNWFNIFRNLFYQRVFKRKGILEAFKYLASTFYHFVKKRVFVRYTQHDLTIKVCFIFYENIGI